MEVETQHLVHRYSCKTVMHHEHGSLRCLDVLLMANAKLQFAKVAASFGPPPGDRVEAEKQIRELQIAKLNVESACLAFVSSPDSPKTSVSVSTDSLLANDVSYMLVLSSNTGAGRGIIAQILHPRVAEYLYGG